ncbi:sensor domain-containing diguanylate cyclase [Clostridium polynesiense]|uniref:sensor domain-containing diguanylate cyclase n=1 Tax=Clostridium polynesiense TaxID=1325933 RepID=UPI00058C9C16|nr:sensor domain-containing diguanylate cyclase [Clostridium polynesiense]
MKDYKDLYINLLTEFETYQNFAESQIQILNEKNTKLEKNLDAFFNVVEISKYINSYLSNENLIPMINDMMIGILGATYSSIYLKENGELTVKATNSIANNINILEETFLREIQNENPFVINSALSIFGCIKSRSDIHSVIGVPIKLREKFMGYIVVEHSLFNFFTNDHIKFISSIANQIGIAIENSLLYKKITESAKKDPLLKIYHRKYLIDYMRNKINEGINKRFAVVMLDLDDFKRINDSYGHLFGDEVLMQTVKLLEKSIGTEDILARYGGEELIIYIKDASSIEEVYKKVNTIREKVSNNIITFGNKSKIITASFGISFYPLDGDNIEELLYIADEMLYEAKETGKNKVLLSKTCSSAYI